MTKTYDLVAIGGGTAGLIATLGVAGLGGRAALIEAERPGGDCLWTGCVPSKALLAAASAAHTLRTADRFGLEPVEVKADLAKVMATVRQAQAAIEPHDSPERLRAAGVDVIEGRGRFVGPGRIQVAPSGGGAPADLRYRTALIATGARPVLPGFLDGALADDVLTSENVWELTTLPDRLLVVGGGPIGCELGQAFARLGSQVTIVEAEASLLPREADDVGQFLADNLKAEGLDVKVGTTVTAFDDRQPGALGRTARLSDGSEVVFDRALIATGRRPNTEHLGLDTVGVELSERGFVTVDDTMATSASHIYAAGDVTGRLPYTHTAANQARLVVTNALFRLRRTVDEAKAPYVTFTDPEIARVGLDAAQARERWGSRALVQRFDLANLDRAITDSAARGWVELVGDPKRRLAGATIVGRSAGESIAEMTAWITSGAKVDAISTTIHAYPTFAEGPSRAADDVLRARYFNPKLTAATSALLKVLRRIDRPPRY